MTVKKSQIILELLNSILKDRGLYSLSLSLPGRENYLKFHRDILDTKLDIWYAILKRLGKQIQV